jgi:hypothetical protein
MVEDAVAQAHARRQRATHAQILVNRVPPDEPDVGNQHFVADLERADFLLR